MDLKTSTLFDLSHTLAGDYLSRFEYPWQALDGIKELILSLGPTLGEDYEERVPQVLRDAILRAGATVLDGDAAPRAQGNLTPADLFALGLSGTTDAAERRAALLRKLELPEHMSAKALLAALNALYTPEELCSFFSRENGPDRRNRKRT